MNGVAAIKLWIYGWFVAALLTLIYIPMGYASDIKDVNETMIYRNGHKVEPSKVILMYLTTIS